MTAIRPGCVTYDTQQMQRDMVALGLNPTTLARRSQGPDGEPISRMTIARFFDGTVQTAKTGLAIARALGRDDASVYIRSSEVAA